MTTLQSMPRRSWYALATVVAFVAMSGAYAGLRWHSAAGAHRTYTVQFPVTPGLYPGNRVNVLGVPTGTIASVTPRPGHVDVVLHVPTSVKIPAEAKAIIVARTPVAERAVELYPAYTSGATLADGAVIPMSRAVTPLELDDIYASISEMSRTLGPNGANAKGSLSSVIQATAALTKGNGRNLHDALEAVAAALPALTTDPGKISQLITSLDQLSTTLAGHDAELNQLYRDLAGATAQLAGEKDGLRSAITTLDDALTKAARFIKDNQATLGTTLNDLTAATGPLVAQRDALAETLDVLPLAFQNLNNAIELNGPCPDPTKFGCPGVFVRLTPTLDQLDLATKYCGSLVDSLVPILALQSPVPLPGVRRGDQIDTLCFANHALLQGHPGPPGGPATPDFGLSQYLGP